MRRLQAFNWMRAAARVGRESAESGAWSNRTRRKRQGTASQAQLVYSYP